MIIKTVQLADPQPKSCFNFTGMAGFGFKKNTCVVKEGNFVTYVKYVKQECIECTMKYTVDWDAIDPNCTKDFECAKLIFDHSYMFEKFFRRHRHKIGNMFPTKRVILSIAVLEIIMTNYNIRQITSDYIHSKVNTDASTVAIFLTFMKPEQGLPLLTIEREIYRINFNTLRINILCHDGNKSASYVLSDERWNDYYFSVENECPKFQSTKQITTSIINTPETTTTTTITTTTTTKTTAATTALSTTFKALEMRTMSPTSLIGRKALENFEEKKQSKSSIKATRKSFSTAKTVKQSATKKITSSLTTLATTQPSTVTKTVKKSATKKTTPSVTTIITTQSSTATKTTTTTTESSTTTTTTSSTTVARETTASTTESSTTTITTSSTTIATETTTTTTESSTTTTTTSSTTVATETTTTTTESSTTTTTISSTTIATETTLISAQTSSTIITTTSSITTTITEIETSTITRDKSFATFDTLTINTAQSSISTLTIAITETTTTAQQIVLTEMSETTSRMIEQTSHTTTSTLSFITTTTPLIDTIEKISTETTIDTILFAMVTRPTLTVIQRSRIPFDKTRNLSISMSTSPKPSQKSHHIIRYIVFGLLSVVICVTITALIVCSLYCCRQRRHFVDEDSSILLDSTNTDAYSNTNSDTNQPESSSNTSSSLLPTQYNETKPPKKSNINLWHLFNDRSF